MEPVCGKHHELAFHERQHALSHGLHGLGILHERLQLVQSIELKQRNIFLSISAVLALVIVLGISYYGSRMIQQRRAEAASARAIAAQQETVDAPAAEVLTLSSQGQSIISGASASARQLIQAAEARKAAQETAAQHEAKGKEAAVIPEGFVLREMTADDIHKGELQLINKTYEYHFLEDDLLSLIRCFYAPHSMKRIHIKGQVIVFPLIIGQRRIGVTIELYKRVYKVP